MGERSAYHPIQDLTVTDVIQAVVSMHAGMTGSGADFDHDDRGIGLYDANRSYNPIGTQAKIVD